jgi:hypothetical protein
LGFGFDPGLTSWANVQPSPFDKLRAGSTGLSFEDLVQDGGLALPPEHARKSFVLSR